MIMLRFIIRDTERRLAPHGSTLNHWKTIREINIIHQTLFLLYNRVREGLMIDHHWKSSYPSFISTQNSALNDSDYCINPRLLKVRRRSWFNLTLRHKYIFFMQARLCSSSYSRLCLAPNAWK